MVDEEVRNVAAGLMLWQSTSARSFKRLRLSSVENTLFRLPAVDTADVRSQYTALTQSSAVMVLELVTKKRQRKYRDEPVDARAKKLEEERRKYSLLLAEVIKQAKLPVVQLVNTLDDPAAGWLHLFAARRANMLKNRYKSWKPFQTWLQLHRGVSFPQSCKDVIDFMQSRVDDECGKTVPESFSVALNLIETLGRVPEDEQISRDPLWTGHVKAWTAELAAESPPRKPAEMYTVAMLVSLEILVCVEDEFIFKRALAWVILVMVWGALRCDDVQSVLPHRSMLSNFGLKLVLGKTKTSGPDKPQKEVMAHIYRTVNFLTSVAALLGFGRDMRAYLGRWAMGMTASEEYVRTARQVAYKIQRAVNRSIVEGLDDEYFEAEAIDNLCKTAEDGGANPRRIRKRHAIMNNLTGRHSLGGTFPTLEVRQGDWDDVQDFTDDQIALIQEKSQEMARGADEKSSSSSSPKYFITVSRRAGHRRLHLTGCFVKPTNCCEVRMCHSVTNEDFDSVCRACKKKMLQDCGKDAPDESSSTASSSSTDRSQDT
eukprot:s3393_g9.t1